MKIKPNIIETYNKKGYLQLIYTLFEPVKHKTGVIGLWKDLTGKIYKDNINLRYFFAINKEFMYYAMQNLFNKGELCIFYKNSKGHAIIENKQGKKDILRNRIQIKEKHLKCSYIKELLNQHNGLTIFRLNKGFLIEIWK